MSERPELVEYDAQTVLRTDVAPGAGELPVMEGGGFAERPGTVILGDPLTGPWEEADYAGVGEDADGLPILTGVTGVDGPNAEVWEEGLSLGWAAGTPVGLKPWTTVERVDFFVPPTAEQARAGRIVQFSTPGYRDYVGVAGWDENDEPVWLLVGTAADAGSLEMRQAGQFGGSGSANGKLDLPRAVAVSPLTGEVYVADFGNNRVQRFSSAGAYVAQWARNGASGVAVSPLSGDVYVTDPGGNGVYRYSATGSLLGSVVASGTGNGQFNTPNGVAVSPTTGSVYVADTGNNRVQRFSAALAYQAQLGTVGSGDGQLSGPRGAAVSPDGLTLYVADTGNDRVQAFHATTGAYVRKWGSLGGAPGQFQMPYEVAVSPDGTMVFVADMANDRVQVFGSDGSALGAFGERGGGSGQFRSPQGVSLSPDGRTVFVLDNGNDRVTLWKDAAGGAFPVFTTRTNSGAVSGGGGGGNVTATCAAGEVMTGGGCAPAGGTNHLLRGNFPASDTSWSCTSTNNAAGSQTLTAYVRCLGIPLS